MNKNKANTWAFVRALLLLLAGSGLCLAEDFTFNVPVALHNLPPEAARVRVSCVVSGQQTRQGKGGGQTVNVNIGTGYKEFAIMNGNFVSTVVVKFNCSPGIDPASATQWRCTLFFAGPKATNTGGQASGILPSKGTQRLEIDRLPEWLEVERFFPAGKIDTSKPLKADDAGALN